MTTGESVYARHLMPANVTSLYFRSSQHRIILSRTDIIFSGATNGPVMLRFVRSSRLRSSPANCAAASPNAPPVADYPNDLVTNLPIYALSDNRVVVVGRRSGQRRSVDCASG